MHIYQIALNKREFLHVEDKFQKGWKLILLLHSLILYREEAYSHDCVCNSLKLKTSRIISSNEIDLK